MTPRPVSFQPTSAAVLSGALAHAGVGLFGLRSLADPDPLFTQLETEHRLEALVGDLPRSWDETCVLLARMAPRLPGPVGELLRDYRLQLHDWFLLALAGENEDSHRLNLALALLQAPEGAARPGLHLCNALCSTLFDSGPTPMQLATHPLVTDGILRIEGDGPLPLRALAMEPRLWSLLRGDEAPWPGCSRPANVHPDLVPSALRARIPRLASLLQGGEARVVAFRSTPQAGRVAAAMLAVELGMRLLVVPDALWRDQPAIAPACRYGGWLPLIAPELAPGDRFHPGPCSGYPGPLALALGSEGAIDADGVVEIEIPPMPLAERRALWRRALGTEPPATLAESALLDGPAIQSLSERAVLEAGRLGEPVGESHLVRARIQLGADRLRQLAHPVARRVSAGALVLPDPLQRRFDDLAQRCARRERLWDGLGITLSPASGTGVRALFVGESGTGKTLAASRLATCLGAPLYRVDLAAVLNKYVGETEKNLGLLLDAAAACDALLLLDEADALFGRRTDGGETGERFANMLTNFLLTRIEAHPGIVILTSNSRSRMDPAFNRRLDAILELPLPGVDERRRLWRSHLGDRSPGDAACGLLASYCDLAGGYLRNAVLAAAARSEEPPQAALPMALLIDGLREEYRKLGRTVPPQLDQLGR